MAEHITWHGLLAALREATDHKEVLAMLKAEQKGPKRLQWMQRMYHRFSALRQQHEMKDLGLK